MIDAVTFGSVCSGIEAASVAFNPIGWRAVWLSEIEANPSLILKHHYPEVPNLGDMNRIPHLLRNGDIFPPDVLCGGTPCQAFSLAGLRNSLDDARGNLSLTFCEIANEIDIQRAANGLLPCVVKWENVPGVLSTKDNAFGHFLAGLAGEDDPLVAPGKKWADAGCVYGPQRTVAWRILDAQYFGLAQRRRRVFVVASARNGFDPAAVLFEFDGVRRDFAPRREQGQDTAGTLASRTDGGGFPGTDEACSGYVQPVGWPAEIAPTLNAAFGSKLGLENQHIQGGGAGLFVPARMPTNGAVFVDGPDSYAIQAGALRTNPNSGPDGVGVQAHIAYTLEARAEVQAVVAPIAFSSKDYGADACTDLSPTLRAGGHSSSHANAGVPPAIAFDSRQDCVSSTDVFGALGSSSPQAQAVCITGHITHTLKAEGFDASEDGTGRGQPIVAACYDDPRRFNGPHGGFGHGDLHPTLESTNPKQFAQVGMAVRRLTPRECERLQGFPDDYTLVPMPDRRKVSADGRRAAPRMMADGPRYKALGNSWAVPVVRWLGGRIDAELRRLEDKR